MATMEPMSLRVEPTALELRLGRVRSGSSVGEVLMSSTWGSVPEDQAGTHPLGLPRNSHLAFPDCA